MTSNTSSPQLGFVIVGDSPYMAIRHDGVVYRSIWGLLFVQIYQPKVVATYKCGSKVAATFDPASDADPFPSYRVTDGRETIQPRFELHGAPSRLAFVPGPDAGLEIPDDVLDEVDTLEGVDHFLPAIWNAWSGAGANENVVARQRQDVRSTFPMLGKALDALGGRR